MRLLPLPYYSIEEDTGGNNLWNSFLLLSSVTSKQDRKEEKQAHVCPDEAASF